MSKVTSKVPKKQQSGKKQTRKSRPVYRKKQPKGNVNATKAYAAKQVKDVLSLPLATGLTDQLKVQVPFDKPSLNLAMAVWTSFLLQKGVHENTENQGIATPWLSVYNGVSFMQEGILTQIVGSVNTLTRLPKGINELIAALAPTVVPALKYGKISYTWSGVTPAGGLQTITNGDGIWNTTYVTGDNELYNSPATVLVSVPSQENYGELLKLVGGLTECSAMKIVNNGEGKTVARLQKDASAFARVYRYNGLNPVLTAGYYKDAELETKINAPIYCNYCVYEQPDKRVPMDLEKCSGDAGLSTGWSLHPTFTTPFNMSSVQYKVIDFEEIYYTLAIWAAKAKEAMARSVINSDLDYIIPFPFTQQDFRIILRQALLNVFDTQYLTQFTGPISDSPGDPQANCFVPFMVMGNTWGSPIFDQFKLPDLIKENIAALRARNMQIPGKSVVNTPTIMPVLGRYKFDEVAEIGYQFEGVTTPLFDTTLAQTSIGLTDGRNGPTSYVNLNGAYYQAVLANWNDFVQAAASVTSEYSSILSDLGPPGLGLLHYTRVEEQAPNELQRGPKPTGKMSVQNMKYIINSGLPTDTPPVDKTKKGGVKAIPPASIVRIANLLSTTSIPLTSAHEDFYNLVITPSIRLNPLDEDALTCNMYQVEVKEVLSIFHRRFPPNSGAGMASKLASYAMLCITGTAKENTNTYTSIMKKMQEHGDAGILANILAGFAKQIIPGADGIIDTIASIVPV